MQHILPFMIPIFGIIFGSLVLIARSPVGQAIGRRIAGDQGVPEDLHQHLAEVQGELMALRQELTETQERLDFAERMLARPEGAPPAGPRA